MTYWPSLLVVAVRVAPVPASRSSTFAPGTPAPEGSMICPSTCPVVSVCPRAGFTCQKTHSENRTVQKKNFTIAVAIFAVITHPPWTPQASEAPEFMQIEVSVMPSRMADKVHPTPAVFNLLKLFSSIKNYVRRQNLFERPSAGGPRSGTQRQFESCLFVDAK